MYFKNFPRTRFLISPPGYKRPAEYVTLVDITTNIRFKKSILDNITLYDYYHIRDGETMDIISEKLYGSPHYNWVLMLLNDMFDYRKDFLMPADVFERYIIAKYGSVETAMSTLIGYANANGQGTSNPALFTAEELNDLPNPVRTSIVNSYGVYAYDDEVRKNEAKRQIKVISSKMLTAVLRAYKDIM